MFKAYVLVRNIESRTERLDFVEFTISRVGLRFQELRELFSSVDVNQDDWVLEKLYSQLPSGPPGSPVGGIPDEIEDALLLLRLYKAGDISFIKQAIILPSGRSHVQFPYRAMNDLNSYSSLRFEVDSTDCQSWKAFADRIRLSQSWTSDWFAAARRFFLCGGAKEFNPKWNDVDRVLDYATALESTLVPENGYNTRRLSNRAALLIGQDDIEEGKGIVKFMNVFYGIRSRLAHGSQLTSENSEWLSKNCYKIERLVRKVLVAAVQKLPPGEDDRRTALSELFDPTDEDRRNFVIEKFKEIKTPQIRKEVADKIAKLAGE